MRIYVDRDKSLALTSQGIAAPLETIQIKRAVLAVVEVVFLEDGGVVELPNDATGRFELKDTGKYDENPLTGAAAWVKFGTGTDTYYQFSFSLITTELNTRFNVDVDLNNDQRQLTLMGEISWRYGTRDYKSQTLKVLVDNDVNRTADVFPASAAIVYVRDSFIRVENTPPDDEVGVDGDCWIYTVTGDLYQRLGGVYVFKMNIVGEGGGSGGVANIMIDVTDPDDPQIMFGEDLEILSNG